MSSYMNARKSSDKRPDATCCLQPAMISGHVMHKYAWIMPPPEPFVLRNDCNAEKNFSDICAAIRHHILDQVASSAPVVSTNQSAVRDVCLLKRPHSATSYSVRGTKWVLNLFLSHINKGFDVRGSFSVFQFFNVSGVYPYLQMAQLSHGQFWGERKKTLE